jgi:hypothetical protein
VHKMQVKCRSHFSGEKNMSYGPGNTVVGILFTLSHMFWTDMLSSSRYSNCKRIWTEFKLHIIVQLIFSSHSCTICIPCIWHVRRNICTTHITNVVKAVIPILLITENQHNRIHDMKLNSLSLQHGNTNAQK